MSVANEHAFCQLTGDRRGYADAFGVQENRGMSDLRE